MRAPSPSLAPLDPTSAAAPLGWSPAGSRPDLWGAEPGPRRRPAVRLALEVPRPEGAAGGRVATALWPYPAVRALLEGRGILLGRNEEENEEGHWNRLATDLMALYRDTGEREVFEALYALTRRSVLSWIRALVTRGSFPFDPHELLQDTFVNVCRYPRSFRDEHVGSFRVWVRTIAGNLVRRSGGRRSSLSFQALPEGLQEPADPGGNPARAAAEADECRSVGRAWALLLLLYGQAWKELSQRDRRTLHLIEVEGLSYLEAGRVLGVGRSNMKMIVFRSRKRITRHIARALAAGRVSVLGREVA